MCRYVSDTQISGQKSKYLLEQEFLMVDQFERPEIDRTGLNKQCWQSEEYCQE